MMYFQWALRLVVVVILHHHQKKCIHYKWRFLTVYVITTKLLSTPPPTFFLSSDFLSSSVLLFIFSSTVSSVFSSSGHAILCSFFNYIIRHYLLSPVVHQVRFHQLLNSRSPYPEIIISSHQIVWSCCHLFSLHPNHQTLFAFTSCSAAGLRALISSLAVIRSCNHTVVCYS